MVETTVIRLTAQVFLVAWCAATVGVVLMARGRTMHTAGQKWAVLGLVLFAGWMFLSALSIRDIELFPRSSVLWLFATLELGTAAGAWGWLGSYVRKNFHVHYRIPHVNNG